MDVTVNSAILQRVDTTTGWAYTNPILRNKEIGFEVDDTYGNPVGMKMGDGATHWDDLPYWFTSSSGVAPELIFIAQGLPIPYVIDMTTGPRARFGLFPTVLRLLYQNIDGTVDDSILVDTDSIGCNRVFNNSSYFALESIKIYGIDDGSGNFEEDTYVILKA